MKTLIVPILDEFTMKFKNYEFVNVNDDPTHEDYSRVMRLLPGLPCGYASAFFSITKTGEPIELTRFYDGRQNARKLKNYFIALSPKTIFWSK